MRHRSVYYCVTGAVPSKAFKTAGGIDVMTRKQPGSYMSRLLWVAVSLSLSLSLRQGLVEP
jgi:hypothetical protein